MKKFFFGFSIWKRGFIKPFFAAKKNEIYFCDNLKDAITNGFGQGDKAFIWGMKNYSDIIDFCQSHDINISLVEDGFIRSISLGSDLTRPYSLVIDSRGIYFDPNKPSDLEYLLLTYEFNEEIKNRAKNLRSKIISSKFSKYNGFSHKKLLIDAKTDQKIILIPGQVEDDASMFLGGYGMTTVKLLQETRSNNLTAYIIFKPHPDVLSGNRMGLKDSHIIMCYCDEMITDASIDSCLEVCDEVHTITSTVGFDALLRNKKVCTYGMPFYAGWGLTSDKFINNRRSKVLELDELVAGALILYPRYISPKTHTFCDVEVAFDEMIDMQKRYFEVAWFRILMDTKIFILRKLRRTIEFVLEKVDKR